MLGAMRELQRVQPACSRTQIDLAPKRSIQNGPSVDDNCPLLDVGRAVARCLCFDLILGRCPLVAACEEDQRVPLFRENLRPAEIQVHSRARRVVKPEAAAPRSLAYACVHALDATVAREAVFVLEGHCESTKTSGRVE